MDIKENNEQDETLDTPSTEQHSTEQERGKKDHKKGGIHNNALFAASMGRSATAQVDPHNTSSLARTGTNTSYEGPTTNAGGGTGFTSGQSGTGATTESNYDQAAITPSQKNNNSEDIINNADETEINQQQ